MNDEHRRDLQVSAAKPHCCIAELLDDVLRVGLDEDRADDRRHRLLRSFRDHGGDVAHDTDSASLSPGTLKNGSDGFVQPGVGVRHDSFTPFRPRVFDDRRMVRPIILGNTSTRSCVNYRILISVGDSADSTPADNTL